MRNSSGVTEKFDQSSGVARVIHDYLDEAMPVYALLVYTKATKTNLTPDEKRVVSTFAAAGQG